MDDPAPAIHLAAIHYGVGEGGAADRLLEQLARLLQERGVRLAGAVQHNTADGYRACCDMTLEDLASGQRVLISENRGVEAQGCRLDSRALENLVGMAAASLDEQSPEFLIINKFGKRECEGQGFREVISAALSAGIPVLAGVNRDSAEGWASYAQGCNTRLPLDLEQVAAWCLGTLNLTCTSAPSKTTANVALTG